MNQVINAEFDIDQRISQMVTEINTASEITLPDRSHPLTLEYAKKIQGKYRLDRSKQDIIDAVALVDIAYKALPQKYDKNRIMIDHLSGEIIQTQEGSIRAMGGAINSCNKISRILKDMFVEWEGATSNNDPDELMDFLGVSMLDGVREIETESLKVSKLLDAIAKQYDAIIAKTTSATDESQKSLAQEKEADENVRKQIANTQAERAKLQSLVSELEDQMRKYERLANEYKMQAESAEERSFITSLVGVFSQMVSAAMPAIAAACTGAATGGASIVAGAAAGTVRKIVADDEEDSSREEKDAIALRKELASKTSEKGKQVKIKTTLEEKLSELENEKAEAESNDALDEEAKTTKVTELQKRIEKAQSDISSTEDKISVTDSRISEIQEALKKFGKGMEDTSEKQQDQAASLRSMQMKMLEKAEEYEKERRNQNAELIKISALLSTHQNDAERIELCIKALEINLAALFQMRSIIIEISFFFASFSSFMNMVAEQANDQAEAIKSAQKREKLTKSFLKRLIMEVNYFFITQSAEWGAAYMISSTFSEAFADGAVTLNRNRGEYLQGDALASYLKEAAQTLAEISARRKSESDGTIIEIKTFKALQQVA